MGKIRFTIIVDIKELKAAHDKLGICDKVRQVWQGIVDIKNSPPIKIKVERDVEG